MGNTIKQLCALTVFFGAALSLAPDGGTKKILELVCAAALILSAAMPLKAINFEDYAFEIAKYREKQAELGTQSGEASDRLNRLVIEEEYRSYILDKAVVHGMTDTSVEVELRWSTEGLWVPTGIIISGKYSLEQKKSLSRLLETELGIPVHSQQWSKNE